MLQNRSRFTKESIAACPLAFPSKPINGTNVVCILLKTIIMLNTMVFIQLDIDKTIIKVKKKISQGLAQGMGARGFYHSRPHQCMSDL